jgi:hypothetical protein
VVQLVQRLSKHQAKKRLQEAQAKVQKVYLSLVGNIHPVTTKDMEAIERILSKCVNRMK